MNANDSHSHSGNIICKQERVHPMGVKIDIVSGFLGAGKTTLIKKLLKEKLFSEKVVLIENEFGEIGIDGGIFKNSGIEIKEMNSGCICCSLVGDFTSSLREVFKKYGPDRVIIEPSGVGKLSGVIEACRRFGKEADARLNMVVAVVDAIKYRMFVSNFGEFFQDQIDNAGTIILSRTQSIDQERLLYAVKDIQKHNNRANIITTPWDRISAETIIATAQRDDGNSLETELIKKVKLKVKGADFQRAGHGPGHMHNHGADEVFSTWSVETPRLFSEDGLGQALRELNNTGRYGNVLRAKGIIPVANGEWVQFDFVPGEIEIKPFEPDYTGRICVIGRDINSQELQRLFAGG